jgi:hypothetical protein
MISEVSVMHKNLIHSYLYSSIKGNSKRLVIIAQMLLSKRLGKKQGLAFFRKEDSISWYLQQVERN